MGICQIVATHHYCELLDHMHGMEAIIINRTISSYFQFAESWSMRAP